jgi:hypothetical protein
MFSRLLLQVVFRPNHLINKSNLFSSNNFNKQIALNKLTKKHSLKSYFTKNEKTSPFTSANFKIKQTAFKTRTRKIARDINENSYNIFKKYKYLIIF